MAFTRLSDSDSTPKTFHQWQELRRSNPRAYFSTEVQNRIAKDIDTLGSDKFFESKEDRS